MDHLGVDDSSVFQGKHSEHIACDLVAQGRHAEKEDTAKTADTAKHLQRMAHTPAGIHNHSCAC